MWQSLFVLWFDVFQFACCWVVRSLTVFLLVKRSTVCDIRRGGVKIFKIASCYVLVAIFGTGRLFVSKRSGEIEQELTYTVVLKTIFFHLQI